MYLPYNKELKERARHFQKNMTEEEQKIWYYYLSKHSFRFLRQKVIDNYIADFYCPKLKLVIEIDGIHHYFKDKSEYDENRTEVLNAYGLRVIRLTNLEIRNDFENVCSVIENILNEQLLILKVQNPQALMCQLPSIKELNPLYRKGVACNDGGFTGGFNR